MRRAAGTSGFSLVQAVVAMAVIVIAGMASVEALILTNQRAAAMRTTNNARAIVQRNIDIALGVPFTTTTVPAVLVTTSSGGALYDEDGDGDTTVKIVVTRNGTGSVVNGQLFRTVIAEANAASADIRRVTFRLDYNYRRRDYSVSMTTLRTND